MDAALNAIADPVRRRILELLRAGSRPAGDIAAEFDISRPAISRHLRVLRESELVRDEVIGRERRYSLDTEPLAAVTVWIAELTASVSWATALDALDTEVHRTSRDRRSSAARETRSA